MGWGSIADAFKHIEATSAHTLHRDESLVSNRSARTGRAVSDRRNATIRIEPTGVGTGRVLTGCCGSTEHRDVCDSHRVG